MKTSSGGVSEVAISMARSVFVSDFNFNSEYVAESPPLILSLLS